MKTLIQHIGAKVRGQTGQRQHRKIVDNVFATRDALDQSAESMLAEIASNDDQIRKLRARSKELFRSATHARTVSGRIAEFFTPR